MRSALAILLVVLAGLAIGWTAPAACASGALAGMERWGEADVELADATNAAKIARPLARRREISEQPIEVKAPPSANDVPVEQDAIRSMELFRGHALASTMSLAAQASKIENWVEAWVVKAPVRFAAELHRVRERQSDP